MSIERASFPEVYEAFKTEFVARAPQTTEWTDFSEQDAMAGAAAFIAEALQAYCDDLFRKTRVGGAKGTELDDLAYDSWRLERLPEKFAVGQLVLARASAAAGAETIPLDAEFETFPDADGQTQRVKASSAYSMTGTSLTIDVVAAVGGLAGNAAAATYDSFVVPAKAKKSVAFSDNTITFTQPLAISGGAPEEIDEDFRSRIRDYIRNRQRATLAAVLLGAKSVGGIASVVITEQYPGMINVYVADVNGTASTPLLLAVKAELDNWRAAGIHANVFGATFKHPNAGAPINVLFTFAPNTTNTDAIKDRAFRLMLAYTNTRGAGGVWFKAMCEGAGRTADPAKILNVQITSPSGNSTPLATEIIHAELGDFRG